MESPLPNPAFGAALAAALLYLVSIARMLLDLRRMQPPGRLPALPLAAIGVCLHAVAVAASIARAPDTYAFGLFESAALFALIVTGFVVLSTLRVPVQGLLLLTLPVSVLSLLGLLFATPGHPPIHDPGAALISHILVSAVAYSLLAIAAGQAVLLVWQERQLRRKRALGTLRLLPPMETMESLLFSLLWAGWIGLTLAIGSGFVFLDDLFAQQVVHHTVLSLASWLIYASLLVGHYLFGWRGRAATYGTLGAFALLVLAYFGSKFVLEILLGR
ncbi:MAG: inner membrane protein YpjD [Gammaproteobacteria bacterium]|jgi:ABC-type uncharacterized transport system permease subunit